MSRIQAVLLDVDGTLIDSNDAHAQAYVDAGKELGVEMDFAEVRRGIGMGGDKLLPEASGIEEESEQGKRITARKKEIFGELLPTLEPAPGARELLERLRADGVKLVVATSAKRDEMKAILEQAGVADLIDAATSASDAEESKPDPDIVEAALEQAGFPAGEVVMLGDTPYDVLAATRAGVRIIGVRTGGWSEDDLHGAVAVYDHPADLLAHYEESPLGSMA